MWLIWCVFTTWKRSKNVLSLSERNRDQQLVADRWRYRRMANIGDKYHFIWLITWWVSVPLNLDPDMWSDLINLEDMSKGTTKVHEDLVVQRRKVIPRICHLLSVSISRKKNNKSRRGEKKWMMARNKSNKNWMKGWKCAVNSAIVRLFRIFWSHNIIGAISPCTNHTLWTETVYVPSWWTLGRGSLIGRSNSSGHILSEFRSRSLSHRLNLTWWTQYSTAFFEWARSA
jgi:hypothetical protein